MKNVRDAGFSRKRGGNAGSGPPLPDPVWPHQHRWKKTMTTINCVALYYEKGASGNAFLPKEKFRAPVSRQVKTLKVLKETVR